MAKVITLLLLAVLCPAWGGTVSSSAVCTQGTITTQGFFGCSVPNLSISMNGSLGVSGNTAAASASGEGGIPFSASTEPAFGATQLQVQDRLTTFGPPRDGLAQITWVSSSDGEFTYFSSVGVSFGPNTFGCSLLGVTCHTGSTPGAAVLVSFPLGVPFDFILSGQSNLNWRGCTPIDFIGCVGGGGGVNMTFSANLFEQQPGPNGLIPVGISEVPEPGLWFPIAIALAVLVRKRLTVPERYR
jgi:hypothetical protein